MLQFRTSAESNQRYCEFWQSPLGLILVCASEVGVTNLNWYDLSEESDEESVNPAYDNRDSLLQNLQLDGSSSSDLGESTAVEAKQWTEAAIQQLREYFGRQRTEFELTIHVHGTAFQEAVWEALAKIPYGETRSYKQIAQSIGKAAAVRAIGQANRSNPVAVIVPCHRVIGANGKLVGYAGSHTELKADLLDIERASLLHADDCQTTTMS
ncbi:methylated-DNA--[protein]-cysteine S-methyltransferase [Alicyclobacillus sp. SO9]|uniref:methylated-DNA--[protein]-cysteine S-methyltransferase n=1 Tax=Alicyclobacillus sp. SO9 TaxID=2665646 RepID=UPI001E415D1F|nr:methylated-DNA--[protein]-cysteine S-methyltransferase [Alicyclobacillus sp. SO9]